MDIPSFVVHKAFLFKAVYSRVSKIS